MKFRELHVKHFKGVSNLELLFGNRTTIIGENGTGKTTILSSITWLLFDKFLEGSTGNPLPVDEAGEVIPGDVSVLLEFDLPDGKVKKLQRIFKEQFTKKRGTASPVKTGHTNEYLIDDEITSATEYRRYVDSLITEELFFILSIPHFFSDQLHWEKRRSYLMELIKKPSIDQVIETDPQLKELDQEFLQRLGESADQNKYLESERIKVMKRMKDINEKLSELPTRIDELKNQIKDINPDDLAKAKKRAEEIEKEIEKIYSSDADKERNALKRELEDLTERMKYLERRKKELVSDWEKSIKSKVDGFNDLIDRDENTITHYRNNISALEKNIRYNEKVLDDLRQEYQERTKSLLNYNPNTDCPTCGQKIPQKQVEEMKERYVETETKAIKDIQSKGLAFKQEKEDHENEIKDIEKQISDREKIREENRKKKNDLLKQTTELPEKHIPEYKKVVDEISSLSEEIKKLEDKEAPEDDGSFDQIKILKEEAKECSRVILNDENNTSINARIKSLKSEIKRYQEDYEGWEQYLYLLELFTRKRVELYEGLLNKKFKLARFKMFEIQMNGGIKEICKVIYDGKSDLSSGERIVIDTDISDTFCKHYDRFPPLLIDNVNNLTLPLETSRQIIETVVKKGVRPFEIE